MKWDSYKTDELLNRFLSGRPYVVNGSHLFESDKSVEVRLYKLGVRFPETTVLYYFPKNREHRDYMDWNDNDRYLLKLAISPAGRKNLAHMPRYLGKLLGRESLDISRRMLAAGQRFKGLFGPSHPPGSRRSCWSVEYTWAAENLYRAARKQPEYLAEF